MKVRNAQAEAHLSSLTPQQFGQAMAQLDLEAIPEHKRPRAIMDHLARIMEDTIQDPEARAAVKVSRTLHAHKEGS